MAVFKEFTVLVFFISLLATHHVEALQANQVKIHANNGVTEDIYVPRINCGGACARRCRLSKRPNLCKRACGTCCARCNCVPPGTYGNHAVCPCYANMTTRHNKRKCP